MASAQVCQSNRGLPLVVSDNPRVVRRALHFWSWTPSGNRPRVCRPIFQSIRRTTPVFVRIVLESSVTSESHWVPSNLRITTRSS
jgi:hypothetical protein